jgi:hypothetical protein
VCEGKIKDLKKKKRKGKERKKKEKKSSPSFKNHDLFPLLYIKYITETPQENRHFNGSYGFLQLNGTLPVRKRNCARVENFCKKKTIELKIKLDRPSIISANQSFHTS